MGKILVIITVFASILLLACGSMSKSVDRQLADSEKGTASSSLSSDQGFSGEGPRGPAGPAGVEGGFDFGESDGMGLAPAATSAPFPTPAPGQTRPPALEDSAEPSSQLETVQRRVISTASISMK
jgi:hypothetical protein